MFMLGVCYDNKFSLKTILFFKYKDKIQYFTTNFTLISTLILLFYFFFQEIP